MANLSQHTEWLSLIEIFGPFLTVPVLEKAFPQGLDTIKTPSRQRLRLAYGEWLDAIDEGDSELAALHREWIRLVLTDILEYDHHLLLPYSKTNEEFSYTPPQNTGTFHPDWIVKNADGKPRLFISVQPPEADLETVQLGDGWPISVIERMILLCRIHGVRSGIITNGERWMLVNAPLESTSGHASWYARLWFQEPVTLKAFQSLLSVRRYFGPPEDNLETLLEESLKYREEVTDTLGEQVRRAVEVLVQCLDKADQDRNRELLRDVSPTELYEAGLTLMMRLVFVLCAEERGLLLSNDPIWDQYYSISTLRGQLSEDADRYGPEVLDRRHDAWSRLLAVFRAIYGGIEHESLRMPALGGSLFDPDQFPFLEGRSKGSNWRLSAATPIPIDNRTVLMLLNALQVLEQRGGALLLSYKTLDVEQIGHVYEGLLEHTVARVPEITLGLIGSGKAQNPNIPLSKLEAALASGKQKLLESLLEVTQRSKSALTNALERIVDDSSFGKLLTVCGGDTDLAQRIRPFFNLLRFDSWKEPIVYRSGAFMVTLGADRRESGTHYTPKSLTESIVSATLEPVVYRGPAEGLSSEQWKLKSSEEILDLKVCDPAMGSGAFLVEACRYLAERLVQSWSIQECCGNALTIDGVIKDSIGTSDPMPSSLDERMLIAKRLVAERCLYGVDVNPLAVELAKLSVWLVTMAKGRPFGFLEHNLRQGDSLLGIHKLDQLTMLEINPEACGKQIRLFGQNIEKAVHEAIDLRHKLRSTPIRDIRDIETMSRLDTEAREKLKATELIADAIIGEGLRFGNDTSKLNSAMNMLAGYAGEFLDGNKDSGFYIAERGQESLALDLPDNKSPRNPFHWALEFPEVFLRDRAGFDSILSNPPYRGGRKIRGTFGGKYLNFLTQLLFPHGNGNADLCSFFIRRTNTLTATNGTSGFLATSSISEGDTRIFGLETLINSGTNIYRAQSRMVWPGKANVTVSPICLFKGAWELPCLLDGKSVQSITSFLSEPSQYNETPKPLKENSELSYQGSIPLGKGFVISQAEAEKLFCNPKNEDVIYPFLVGQELNTHPHHKASKWIINFHDWPLDKTSSPEGYTGPVAADYPDCLEIIRQRVYPERTRRKLNGDFALRKPLPQKWWIYGDKRPELYLKLKNLKWALAIATQATKFLAFGQVAGKCVYSHAISIITSDDYGVAATLSSSIHEIWARKYGSYNLLLIRYATSDLFDTFSFPPISENLRQYGQDYFMYRSKYMSENNVGLTETYNQFHNPEGASENIKRFRELHIKIDDAVLAAYGWNDIAPDHGFYTTNQGTRFTVSETARSEILERLLKLNYQRYEEETRQRLHEKNLAKRSLAKV